MKFSGINNSEAGVRKVGVENTVTASRAAVLFLLDESGSMSSSMESLNAAINRFPNDVCSNHRLAQTNIEVAVMAFDSNVRLVSDWTPLGSFTFVSLTPKGGTNLGCALEAAIEKVKKKLDSHSCDIAHIVLITDGYGGSVTKAAHDISQMKKDGNFVFWMLGVPGYDPGIAQELTGGERLYLLDNKQFYYKDFINMLASAVVKMKNENSNPTLRPMPKIKRLDSSPTEGSFSEGSSSGGLFGGGKFGKGKN